MQTYVLRIWMPDRPGALGAVASRIGAVRGDVVGIDILERGAGRAIDELVVCLPDEVPIALLVQEVGEVDGVDVEDLRPVADALHDPRVEALENVARLVAASSPVEVLDSVCGDGARAVGATWAAVVDVDRAEVLAAHGAGPAGPWLAAFVDGSRAAALVTGAHGGAEDVLWAPMPGSDLALVMGRPGMPFRARERRQAAALARIADTRLREVAARFARDIHPSAGR
jgi:hypothetical protein